MVPGAPYLCVEPWYGFPDFTDSNYIFKDNKTFIEVKLSVVNDDKVTIEFKDHFE